MNLSLKEQLVIMKLRDMYKEAIENDDAALCYELDEEIFHIEMGGLDD